VLGPSYGGLHGRGVHGLVITLAATLVFGVLALSTVRRLTTDIDTILRARLGHTRSSVLTLLTAVLGFAITALIALQLLAIPVGQLLLGGAITGIIIGIAAQQSLGDSQQGWSCSWPAHTASATPSPCSPGPSADPTPHHPQQRAHLHPASHHQRAATATQRGAPRRRHHPPSHPAHQTRTSAPTTQQRHALPAGPEATGADNARPNHPD